MVPVVAGKLLIGEGSVSIGPVRLAPTLGDSIDLTFRVLEVRLRALISKGPSIIWSGGVRDFELVVHTPPPCCCWADARHVPDTPRQPGTTNGMPRTLAACGIAAMVLSSGLGVSARRACGHRMPEPRRVCGVQLCAIAETQAALGQ